MTALLKSREAILALAILVLLALVAGRFPGFVAPRNLASVFTDTAPLIILALGQMVVILTKCIDLSVAANLALCGMVAALMNGAGVPLPLILLAVVVLGGLLEDQFATGEDKVPGLGDIPLLGNLFKNQTRSYVKTNLMVFLRPVIVRDGAATEAFSLDRYDYMRAAQSASQPEPSSVLQINQAPVLPAVQPVNPAAWTRPAPPPPLIRPAAGEHSDPGGGATFSKP